MPDQVIDASNSIETFGVREHGIRLQVRQTATVKHDGSIITHGDWSQGIAAEVNTTVNIEGQVLSPGSFAVVTKGTVNIAEHGAVSGIYAIILYGGEII